MNQLTTAGTGFPSIRDTCNVHLFIMNVTVFKETQVRHSFDHFVFDRALITDKFW